MTIQIPDNNTSEFVWQIKVQSWTKNVETFSRFDIVSFHDK